MPVALSGFLLGLVSYDSATQWFGIITTVHPLWTALVLFCPLLVVTLTAAIRQASIQGAGPDTEPAQQDVTKENADGSTGQSPDAGDESPGDLRSTGQNPDADGESLGDAGSASEINGATGKKLSREQGSAAGGPKQSGSSAS
jgi:spore germination protein KB